MKRMLLAALATSMLALFAPPIAAAQHRHHHRGHARVHKGHAKTSRLLVFGSAGVLYGFNRARYRLWLTDGTA